MFVKLVKFEQVVLNWDEEVIERKSLLTDNPIYHHTLKDGIIRIILCKIWLYCDSTEDILS